MDIIPPVDAVETFDFNGQRDVLFTDVFFRLSNAKSRFIVVYGGAGSSKSYSAHQHALLELMRGKPGLPAGQTGDILVVRKYAADLRESCYKLFRQLIDGYGLQEYFKFNYSNEHRKITYLPNGRSLVFRGCDDPEKLKSIVAFGSLLIEEATQLEFEDFLELNRRLRGIPHIRITLLLNPVSENHWIKTRLCDPEGSYAGQTSEVRCTYNQNRNQSGESFLTPADIAELERLKEINENHYRIYVLAEWGVDNTEGKFCWAFKRSQIVPTQMNEEVSAWLSFDFNVDPLTCTVAQVFPYEQTVRAIECLQLSNSNIYEMCNRIKASYPDTIWFVTGDATGQNRSALSRDNVNYYHVIRLELGLSDAQMKMTASNPPIEDNRLLVNAMHQTWTVEIDPVRCKPLIYDLTYVEVNGRGEIIKDRSSSKKYADFLDCWRYLVNTAVKEHLDFYRR